MLMDEKQESVSHIWSDKYPLSLNLGKLFRFDLTAYQATHHLGYPCCQDQRSLPIALVSLRKSEESTRYITSAPSG